MSQIGQLYALETDPATQFVGVIAQNAQELIAWAPDLAVAGTPTARCRVRAAAIISVENLDWVLWFWNKASGPTSNPATNPFIGFLPLPAAGAKRIGATGLWYYYISGQTIDLPYVDDDTNTEKPDPLAPSGRIHLGLQPTSAGKAVGELGSIKVILYVDPTHG